MIPKPTGRLPLVANTTFVFASSMLRRTRSGVQLQPSPRSIRSRDIRAIDGASSEVARRRVRPVSIVGRQELRQVGRGAAFGARPDASLPLRQRTPLARLPRILEGARSNRYAVHIQGVSD